MDRLVQLAALLGYVGLARATLAVPYRSVSRVLFAIVNVLGLMLLYHRVAGESLSRAIGRTTIYIVLVAIHYVLMRRIRPSSARSSWGAIFYPIILLVALKYCGFLWEPVAVAHGLPVGRVRDHLSILFIGISYLAFRLSHLAVEVRDGSVRMPTLAEHLAYSFFLPTMAVGPISPGSTFIGSLDAPSSEATPMGRSLLRILVGATKYLFVAGALVHLTYSDLLGDGHPHAGATDWIVSSVAYYLYLYCNFSGFCDMAIGAAGLMGVSVVENFNNPLVARNIKDFWSRWHISLSNYVREMLFLPLSMTLVRFLGPRRGNHAIAIALLITFIATGVWHGAGLNFLLFGLLHAGAMVVHHYYTLFLRKRLSRDSLMRYEASAAIRAVAVVFTFAFVTVSFFVFANDLPSLRRLLEISPNLPERRELF
jgi:D-alanyl-lipoteichoic acid acyltransferase DltB (MBOAT superfamily)